MGEPRVITDFEVAGRTSWGKQTFVLNPGRVHKGPLAVRSFHIV